MEQNRKKKQHKWRSPWERICKSWTPLIKCIVSQWLAINNRCWGVDRLAKHGLHQPSACPLFAIMQRSQFSIFLFPVFLLDRSGLKEMLFQQSIQIGVLFQCTLVLMLRSSLSPLYQEQSIALLCYISLNEMTDSSLALSKRKMMIWWSQPKAHHCTKM